MSAVNLLLNQGMNVLGLLIRLSWDVVLEGVLWLVALIVKTSWLLPCECTRFYNLSFSVRKGWLDGFVSIWSCISRLPPCLLSSTTSKFLRVPFFRMEFPGILRRMYSYFLVQHKYFSILLLWLSLLLNTLIQVEPGFILLIHTFFALSRILGFEFNTDWL